MKLTVTQGEPPWEPGEVFEANFPVQLEVVIGEPPWEVGRKLVATLDQPEESGVPSRLRIRP